MNSERREPLEVTKTIFVKSNQSIIIYESQTDIREKN